MQKILTSRQVLCKYKITPIRRYGQNFLINSFTIRSIIKSFGNIDNEIIFEIGAGIGALTNHLLRTNIKTLFVVEIDKKILPILYKIQLYAIKHFEIINTNGLEIKEKYILKINYIIVANLPYKTSSLFIIKWLKMLKNIKRIIVMVQKEVAERILSEPFNCAYGKISVLSQLTCNCISLFNIMPKQFWPIPTITSTIIQLTPKKQELDINEIINIEKLCTNLFNFKRKKIGKSLKIFFHCPKYVLQKLNINYFKRPDQLTLNEFFKISAAM